MSDKQAAMDAIGRMPDGVSLREIRRAIEFLAAVREGDQQANLGKVIPLEQVEQNFQALVSKHS